VAEPYFSRRFQDLGTFLRSKVKGSQDKSDISVFSAVSYNPMAPFMQSSIASASSLEMIKRSVGQTSKNGPI